MHDNSRCIQKITMMNNLNGLLLVLLGSLLFAGAPVSLNNLECIARVWLTSLRAPRPMELMFQVSCSFLIFI